MFMIFFPLENSKLVFNHFQSTYGREWSCILDLACIPCHFVSYPPNVIFNNFSYILCATSTIGGMHVEVHMYLYQKIGIWFDNVQLS